MDNLIYNTKRYNRKKQWYRFRLGAEQLICHPILNLIWILFITGLVLIPTAERKLNELFDAVPVVQPVIAVSFKLFAIFFLIICAVAVVQFIGGVTARKDEGDLNLVFSDRKDIRQLSPILVSKKKTRNKDVTAREFYTTIPMEKWQNKKEAISDVMNIFIIGDIEYSRNNGNHVVIKSIKGRKPKKRGNLYDDIF